jgi:hypothetical protein
MSVVHQPPAAPGRLRPAGAPGRAAGWALALALVAVLLPWAPAGTGAAHAWVVLSGLLGSFAAALLGWAAARRTPVPADRRRRIALAGTVVGTAGVCLFLLQLPDVVLFLLSGG